MTLLFSKLIEGTDYQYEIMNQEKAKELGWEEHDIEPDYTGNRFWLVGHVPEKPQSEKEQEVRKVRAKYFDKYVDFYQSKPLYWEELDEETKQSISDYRVYLKDYTKEDKWWEKNPMTYEEWKESK